METIAFMHLSTLLRQTDSTLGASVYESNYVVGSFFGNAFEVSRLAELVFKIFLRTFLDGQGRLKLFANRGHRSGCGFLEFSVQLPDEAGKPIPARRLLC
jgi:hypothetical protein